MSDMNNTNIPSHIGFIMDGNGRWATGRGMPRTEGHKEGAETFKKIVKYCRKIKIKYISFYAFSTENWKRPKEEVKAIMSLFDGFLNEIDRYADQDARVIFLGDKSVFDEKKQRRMEEIEQQSQEKCGITILVAVNYGGRDEIIHAVRTVAQKIKDGKADVSDINESMFSGYLYTNGVPDLDLLIRPSGELRTSNFLIWQSAYAELYFTDVLWPDFSEHELDKALIDYSSRKRRFGGI